jgi:hypothetical protein
MKPLTIRDLQKLSSKSIAALPGPTPVKSGERTVAILTPIKPPNSKELERALKEAKEAALKRDPIADDAALRAAGVDPAGFPDEAIDSRLAEHVARKPK